MPPDRAWPQLPRPRRRLALEAHPPVRTFPQTAIAQAGPTGLHPNKPHTVRPLWPAQGLLHPQLLLLLEHGAVRPRRQNCRVLSKGRRCRGHAAGPRMGGARGWRRLRTFPEG
eukprot:bmy_04156T0